MKHIHTITLNDGTDVLFGHPSTPEEMEEMFALRYQVYVEEKKYIPSEESKDGVEKDYYDENDKCTYFIATVEGIIIGSVRLIRSVPLPTESDYYKFETPSAIAILPPEQRGEIGRLISRPHILIGRNLPRHIVVLGLFYTMAEFGIKNQVMGGYGSIKSSALEKLKKMGVPFIPVKNYSAIYNPKTSKDPLKNFFSDKDPVKLVYFLTPNVFEYLNILFSNKKFFEKKDSANFVYKDKRLNLFDIIRLRALHFIKS